MKKILFLILLFPILACAANAGPPMDGLPAHPSPIETKMSLGLFGLLGSSMEYSIDGKPINEYRDFKKLIYPLQDEEASQLIRNAEDCHFIADIIYVGGTAVALDVVFFFQPVVIFHDDFFDRVATGAVTSQFIWAAGLLFDLNAAGQEFNAVQRYNKLIRQEEQKSESFYPGFFAGKSSFGLCLSRSF